MPEFPKIEKAHWSEATDKELIADEVGFTYPNLHRRVEQIDGAPARKYKAGIYDQRNSYRVTDYSTHDEESTTCEIP